MFQLSHPHMTTGKTIVLTIRALLAKGCLCFLICCLAYLCHSFSSKEQMSFNFMAAVTFCSDFGAQENKMSLFPFMKLMKQKLRKENHGHDHCAFSLSSCFHSRHHTSSVTPTHLGCGLRIAAKVASQNKWKQVSSTGYKSPVCLGRLHTMLITGGVAITRMRRARLYQRMPIHICTRLAPKSLLLCFYSLGLDFWPHLLGYHCLCSSFLKAKPTSMAMPL